MTLKRLLDGAYAGLRELLEQELDKAAQELADQLSEDKRKKHQGGSLGKLALRLRKH